LQAVLSLASAQLCAFYTLIRIRPQSLSSSKPSFLSGSHELGSAAQGMVQLTIAVLEYPGSQIKHLEGAFTFVHQLFACMAAEAVRLVHLTLTVEAGNAGSGALEEQSAVSPAVLQLLHSEQLLRLLVGTQALHTQLLQLAAADTAGSSSSSSSSSKQSSRRLGSSTAAAESAPAAAAAFSASASTSAASELLRTAGFSWTCTPALRQLVTVANLQM
jgi:hypothetical protein